MTPKPKPPRPCQNCGQPAGRYQTPRGHWVYPRFCAACRQRFRHPSGEDHWHWQGGERSLRRGYVRIYVAPGQRELEHRAIWEAAHGPIPSSMHIHHRNGDKTDNRLENLHLLTNSEHQAEHRPERAIRERLWSRAHRQCLGCGTTERPHQARGLCNRCYLRYWYTR